MSFEWYDWVRVLTVCLAFASLYKLSRDGIMQWHIFTERFKGLWWAMNMLLILVIYSVLEAIVQDLTFGSRQVLALIVVTFTLHAAFKKDTLIKQGHVEKPY